jgi:hypothetical protein
MVMKKLLSLCLVALITSCSTYKVIYNASSGCIDYSTYTEKGFFITESNSVSFDYKTMGSLYVEISYGYEKLSEKSKTYVDVNGIKKTKTYIKTGNWINATSKIALDSMYNKSLSLNANGIINLQTKYFPATFNNNNIMVTGDKIIITGMAIKIKDKHFTETEQ